MQPALVEPFALDASSPGAARLSVESAFPRPASLDFATPELVARLDAIVAAADAREARALTLLTQAALFDARDDRTRAHEALLRSLSEDPKVAEGSGNAWEHILFTASDATVPKTAAAWEPWSTHAQDFIGVWTDDRDVRVRQSRRAHVLSRAGIWSSELVEYLVIAGKREEARTVAAQTTSEGLRVLVDASEARFGASVVRAKRALAHVDPTYAGANDALYVAGTVTPIYVVLGRPLDYAEPLVAALIDRSPPLLPGVAATISSILMCSFAPPKVAARCFARVRAYGVSAGGLEVVLDGAERFAQGDFAGAAKAWRPAIRTTNWWVDAGMRDALAIAFERAGDLELAERLDAPIVAKGGRYNGIELAHVRAAWRAEKRGDKELAKKLAQQVIDAWSVADEEVPAVVEMRKLLLRLK
jgi:hypothetical protein